MGYGANGLVSIPGRAQKIFHLFSATLAVGPAKLHVQLVLGLFPQKKKWPRYEYDRSPASGVDVNSSIRIMKIASSQQFL
jgi:hypothetical protein